MVTPDALARTRQIGGKEWTITLLPATKGLDVGRRLLRLVGPSIGQALGGAGRPGSLLDVDSAALGNAVSDLALRIGEPEAAALVKELVTTGVFCDGKEVRADLFDLLFAGDYETLLRVAAFVVEVNFRVPLGRWLDAARALAARSSPKPIPEQPTS